MQEVDLLILGAGWTSTFLIPLLKQQHWSHAATSTTGRDGTTKFKFDPSTTDPSYFSVLPTARNILITFPLTGPDQSKQLVAAYKDTHRRAADRVRFLQLGSTGIFQIEEQPLWVTRKSFYDTSNKRAVAEDQLRSLGGCVLNLAGLWGGERDPKNWVDRVATTKEQVGSKTSLHMIHGQDVARAIVAIFEKWDEVPATGERWMLTDGFVYDWWALFAGWAASGKSTDSASVDAAGNSKADAPSQQSRWVYELMQEQDVKALPRSMEALGRCYDSREFWHTFDLTPLRSRI